MAERAAEHDLRLSFGLEKAVLELQSGLRTLGRTWSTGFFALLHSPGDEPSPLAGDVAVALEQGSAENFFRFLAAIAPGLMVLRDPSIFFAIGWHADGRVRRSIGSLDDLVGRLNSPCSWMEPLYDPRSDSVWCDDESPLLFTFKKEEESLAAD